MLSTTDLQQLQTSGRSSELIQRQYEHLTAPKVPLAGIRPAKLGDGIFQLSEEEADQALQFYNNKSDEKRWIKFVPASGAASRMFSPLHSYLEALEKNKTIPSSFWDTSKGKEVKALQTKLKTLPFFGTIFGQMKEAEGIDVKDADSYFKHFVHLMLANYANQPKGLIPFFTDEKGQEWTPFEVQLLELIRLSQRKGVVPLHLTIDKAHRKAFDAAFKAFNQKRSRLDFTTVQVEYSHQHPLTDTPYIDKNKAWVREANGTLAFRKGGHGALLENLNQLDADCVWIKNIDNVQLGAQNAIGELWMKRLAGQLLLVQEKLFAHLIQLSEHKEKTDLAPIIAFIQKYFDPQFSLKAEGKMSHAALYDYLHRPLRVCGMIPNAGAVGGGPFWKKETRGQTLQIIEGVELDPNEATHKKALEEGTHFNPVMMVCGITDFRGKKFALHDFRDEKRYMVSEKADPRQPITILEWPGLWNGGMAFWNTLFIELPAETFHPVKSIMDLIR